MSFTKIEPVPRNQAYFRNRRLSNLTRPFYYAHPLKHGQALMEALQTQIFSTDWSQAPIGAHRKSEIYFVNQASSSSDDFQNFKPKVSKKYKSGQAEPVHEKFKRRIPLNKVQSICLPKIAAIVMVLVNKEPHSEVSDRKARKILIRVVERISLSVADELFNNSLARPEKHFLRHYNTMQRTGKQKLQNYIPDYQRQIGTPKGTIKDIADKIEKQNAIDPETSSEQSSSSEDHHPLNNFDQQKSRLNFLIDSGHWLHDSFIQEANEDGQEKLIAYAQKLLFRLEEGDSEESDLLKQLLIKGRADIENCGLIIEREQAYMWIRDRLKGKSHNQKSGRPVENVYLDKVAMSSVYSMIQRGLLPHFDYLIAKQIAQFLESSEGNKTIELRSEGWKRKFNARYQRYSSERKEDYFGFPIPFNMQEQFVKLFRIELLSKARYLSYKKKELYDWLQSTTI